MDQGTVFHECDLENDDPLRSLLERTARAIRGKFFDALVEYLERALNTQYAWVTEYLPGKRRLRALAFWGNGKRVPEFEVDICGPHASK
jgi:hypothetical protein